MGPCGQTADLHRLNLSTIKICDGCPPGEDHHPLRRALVTSCTGDEGATPLSTPQLGGFIGCPRGDLFLHLGPLIEFSRGHCGASGKRALPDHGQALRSNDRWSIFRSKRSSRFVCLNTRRMPCIHARYQLGVAALSTHAVKPQTLKVVLCTIFNKCPFPGKLVCAGSVPNGEKSALPATRQIQVERG